MTTPSTKKAPSFTGSGVSSKHCAAAAQHGWNRAKSPEIYRSSNPDFSMAAAAAALSRPSSTAPAPRSTTPSTRVRPQSMTALSPQTAASLAYPAKREATTADSDTDWSMSAARGALEQSFAKPKPKNKRHSMPPAPPAHSENALSAATVAHAPFSGSALHSSSASQPFTTTPRSMYSAAAVASYGSNGSAAISRQASNDKDHQAQLHASALVMAQQMFAMQANGGSGTGRMRTTEESLHDRAFKLAQERLAQMDNGMTGVRDSQDYYIAKDRAGSRKFSRLGQHRERENESDGESDGEIGPDGMPRSIFAKRMSASDLRKQQNERDALMLAARRNVQNTLADIDEEAMGATGRLRPRRVTAWEAKAAHKAARRNVEAANAEDPLPSQTDGQYNVGGGLLVDKDHVEQLANQNLQPLFTEISENAAAERERKEKLRLEEEENKKQMEADKARKGKLAEIGSIFSSQKKGEEKQRKKLEKEKAKQEKQIEKQKKKEEKEEAKAEKEAIKEEQKVQKEVIKEQEKAEKEQEKAEKEQEKAEKEQEKAENELEKEQIKAEKQAEKEREKTIEEREKTAGVLPSFEVPRDSDDYEAGRSMGSTVGPEELSQFPAVPATGLSPISEFSTPTGPTMPLSDMSADGSTHATTVENPGVATIPEEYKRASPAPVHELAAPVAVAAPVAAAAPVATDENPRQSMIESATDGPLHPLQSNPTNMESRFSVSASPGPSAVYDDASSSAVRSVPYAELSRDERREASLERSRQTQLNKQEADILHPDYIISKTVIPGETESSPADRVRSWFRAHVRSRRDISEVGALDISDMVPEGSDPTTYLQRPPMVGSTGDSYGAAAGESISDASSTRQKKRSSFLDRLTGKQKTEEKREFVHEPRGRAREPASGVSDASYAAQNGNAGLEDDRPSRFKEIMP